MQTSGTQMRPDRSGRLLRPYPGGTCRRDPSLAALGRSSMRYVCALFSCNKTQRQNRLNYCKFTSEWGPLVHCSRSARDVAFAGSYHQKWVTRYRDVHAQCTIDRLHYVVCYLQSQLPQQSFELFQLSCLTYRYLNSSRVPYHCSIL